MKYYYCEKCDAKTDHGEDGQCVKCVEREVRHEEEAQDDYHRRKTMDGRLQPPSY